MVTTTGELTQANIESGLRALGLSAGDVIEVHSSLSSFGWVEGGAETVVNALMSVVGKQGAIADAFRRRPGVAAGSGPFRVCTWGRDTALFVRDGFAALLEVDGLTLLLGVDIHRCSSMHQAERRVGLPPEVEACYRATDAILRDYHVEDWHIQCGDTP